MAQTCSSLSEVLKEVWNKELIGAQMDMSRSINRQFYSMPITLDSSVHGLQVDMSPAAVRERKKRQNEMMQRLAIAKRKGKPSYRQRQKNAKAARV